MRGSRCEIGKRGDLELFLFGDKAVAKALNALTGAKQKRIMTVALRKEAKALKATAQGLAPKGETGQLARKLQVRAMKRSRVRFGIVVRTAPAEKLKGIPRTPGTRKPGYYPAHIELGTKHAAAKPFLRPARDKHEQGLLKRVGADLWAGLRDLAAKEAQKQKAPPPD